MTGKRQTTVKQEFVWIIHQFLTLIGERIANIFRAVLEKSHVAPFKRIEVLTNAPKYDSITLSHGGE